MQAALIVSALLAAAALIAAIRKSVGTGCALALASVFILAYCKGWIQEWKPPSRSAGSRCVEYNIGGVKSIRC